MAERHPQMRPTSKELAPDPASSYERAKPEKEAGMGRLDNNVATPRGSPDRSERAVTNQQPPRQINAEDVVDGRARNPADGAVLGSEPGSQPELTSFDDEQKGRGQTRDDSRNSP